MTSARSSGPGQPNRLSEVGLIDRSRPLSFCFDGTPYCGYQGDTLAAALLAANVRWVGRSFKYHRPRGILTAGSEEPNALVELRRGVRREANTRATVAELFEGLEARSQNRWPSLGFDIRSIHSLLAPLLVAGFYYKTFMWPAAFWEKVYEPLIRRAAGLGHAAEGADPDKYEKVHAFCDVLIIGSGPAGLAAAVSAGRAGARVILCDEDFVLGGRLNGDRREIDGMSGADWARQIESELGALPEVRILRRTTVFGAYDGGLSGAGTFGALERVADHLLLPHPDEPRQRLWRIVAGRTVLATGAIEQPMVFGDNDRPGVMMASAVRTYANRFGVATGTRIVLFTATDDGWETALDLESVGVAVEAVLDARADISPALMRRAQQLDAPVLLGARVVRACGARGLTHVEALDARGGVIRLPADTLAVSGGWNPNLALATHLGKRLRWSESLATFVPQEPPRGMTIVGAAVGSLSLRDALLGGTSAGTEAAVAAGYSAPNAPRWHADDDLTEAKPFWFVSESQGKPFVDFQHDVTCEDISLAVREGFRSVELLKRYTTLGMATDQGKTSTLNGHAIMGALTARSVPEVGMTTARPPYTPVAIGALAGHHRGKQFRPTRLTPAHSWAKESGATFVEVGLWLRARWFSARGEGDASEAIAREVGAVRSCVGVCDVSTLGKLDIQGMHAGEFLDRIYINTFSTLAVGSVRYGLMLREDGFAMDDGTVARLAANHFLMTTTTANAENVLQHLTHASQVLWPDLDVHIVPVTEQWAQFAITGPKARLLLERLLAGAIDVSNTAFPYLACAEFSWHGLRARLFRVSFSGELGFELAIPARYADAVVRAVMSAGESLGVVAYGLDALDVLRIEKGHVAGNEINGMTTANDLGFGRLMSRKKDFIGRVLAGRPALIDPRRPVLVGLRAQQKAARLQAGAHLLSIDKPPVPENDDGYVTSAAFSPTLGHWIGLGFLVRGRERIGERIRAYDPVGNGDTDVQVVTPGVVDPGGSRLRR